MPTRRAVSNRNANISNDALSTTAARANRIRSPEPISDDPTWSATELSADSPVDTISPIPSTTSIVRLSSRAVNGFGRCARGTAHTLLNAFCAAWTTPRLPYRPTSRPTTTATVLPRSECTLSASCWPSTGTRLTAESSTRSCSAGSLCSRKPSTEVSSNSSGNSDRNA